MAMRQLGPKYGWLHLAAYTRALLLWSPLDDKLFLQRSIMELNIFTDKRKQEFILLTWINCNPIKNK